MGAVMHSRAEINEAGRLPDQRGQYVRSQRIDREDLWQAVDGRDASIFAITNAGIVNDCVKLTEAVDLVSHATGFLDTRQVADDHSLCTRCFGAGDVGSLRVAGMENYLVSRSNQKLSRHLPQAVG